MRKVSIKEMIRLEGIFTDKYYRLCELAQRYVVSLVHGIFRQTGMLQRLTDDYNTAEGLVSALELERQSIVSIRWMLDFLAMNGLLEKKSAGYKLILSPEIESATDIEKSMLELDSGISSFLNLTRKVFDQYPDFFRGRRGIDVVFLGNGIELWNDYFSDNNGLHRVCDHLGAECLIQWLDGRREQVLLELGAGCGSAASGFLKNLKYEGRHGLIKDYILSDISPTLLRMGLERAQAAARESAVSLERKKLDFDKEFSVQGIARNSIDVIYGVNSLHITKNILFTLRQILDSLKKGGMLLISESVRSPENRFLFQEGIFNILDGYRNVELEGEARPNAGFLSTDNWVGLFNAAGFDAIEVIDEAGTGGRRPPRRSVAAIKGIKP